MNPAPMTETTGTDVIEPVPLVDSGEINDQRAFSAFGEFDALFIHGFEFA